MAEEPLPNSVRYPEMWKFFESQARNIKNEPDISHLGNYRIPEPNRSGKFIYSDTVEGLWTKLFMKWDEPNLEAISIRGKIQYIVQTFK